MTGRGASACPEAPVSASASPPEHHWLAWCETREDYRHFKTDRIEELKVLGKKYPGRRAMLIKEWEEAAQKNRG